MAEIFKFPDPNVSPKVVLSFDDEDEHVCPACLLARFLEMAQTDELVFVGIHAVRRDGSLVQAATMLVTPE